MSNNPFQFLDSINWTKEDILDPEAENEYKPFIINRSLSYHPDAIFQANDMNERSSLDGTLQYAYFINSLSKRKRFAKWVKPFSDENVTAVMEYFQIGRLKALEALKILSEEQVSMIHDSLKKGGVKNESRKNRRGSNRDPAQST